MSLSSVKAEAVNDDGMSGENAGADNTDRCLRLLGLQQNPFSMAPDIANFYSPPRIEAIIVEVLQLVETRMGFALLYGDVGLGKTTLSRRILLELERCGVQTALVFNTFFQGAELLREINRDFGVAVDDETLPTQMAALNSFLLEQRARGDNCVIIIDDAQNLTVESLELVRQISNMETGIDKIVQIILIGQSELEEKLNLHSLRQLQSRIALKRAFRPYTLEETATYIRTKLARSAERFTLEVTDAAVRRVHSASTGSPRRINVIMSRCLYAAVATNSTRITRSVADLAISDVNETIDTTDRVGIKPHLIGAVTAALLISITFLTYEVNRHGLPDWSAWRGPLERVTGMRPAPPDSSSGGAAVADAGAGGGLPALYEPRGVAARNHSDGSSAPSGSIASAGQVPDSGPTRSTDGPAVADLGGAGRAPVGDHTDGAVSTVTGDPDPGGRAVERTAGPGQAVQAKGAEESGRGVEPAVRGFLEAYGLSAYATDFENALDRHRLQSVSKRIRDEAGLRLVRLPASITGVKRDYATLRVPSTEGDAAAYLLFWKPRSWDTGSFSAFYRSKDIVELQKLLKRFGTYDYFIDGLAGPRTTAAVKAFQQGVGLPATGAPDVRTLFMLEYLSRGQDTGRSQPASSAVVSSGPGRQAGGGSQ